MSNSEYKFEPNRPQLEINVRDASSRLQSYKDEVMDLVKKINKTKNQREKDELEQLLKTTRAAVQYWTTEHKNAVDALKKAK